MTALWDFSELRESAALFDGLLARRKRRPAAKPASVSAAGPALVPAARPAPVPAPRPALVPAPRPTPVPAPRPTPVLAATPTPVLAAKPAPVATPTPEPALLPLPLPPIQERRTAPRRFREELLRDAIADMCRRAGFHGTVITDSDGLPLALHNSPIDTELVGAFTTVLGLALERANRLLDSEAVHSLSLDMGLTDKAVLRRFAIDDRAYYMLVMCDQEVDPRSEIELSVDRLTTLLAVNGGGSAE